jgi:hypothetical protein
MTETPLPAALTNAVAALWRIPPPGPNNLLSAPRFVHLRDTCESLYSNAGSRDALGIALSNAVRALGLPCGLVPANAHLALPAAATAAQLDEAFRRTHGLRVYLCPLDEADELPELRFGPNNIRTFTTAELEALVDLPRLKRINSSWTFDAARFSRFSWLVVEETYPFNREPGQRAVPWLSMRPLDFNRDWGQIKPHRGGFRRPWRTHCSLSCWRRGETGCRTLTLTGVASGCHGSSRRTMISSSGRRSPLLRIHSPGSRTSSPTWTERK